MVGVTLTNPYPTKYSAAYSIFVAIGAERLRQDIKWGPSATRGQAMTVRQTVLTEEVGEVAKAILHGPIDGWAPLREELIQVAAVAVSMVEMVDGGMAPWGFEEGEAG